MNRISAFTLMLALILAGPFVAISAAQSAPGVGGRPDAAPPEREMITVFESVHFRQGSSEILPASLPTLDQIARQLKDGTGGIVRVRLRGHAYDDGAEDAQKLSEARARRVEAYLVAAGVPAEKIRAEWVGADRPVTGVDAALVPLLSRRVEFLPVTARDLPLP